MALPGIFSPTEPQASEAVASGPAKLQANFQTLADVLGLPVNPTQITAQATAITSGGIATISQPGATVVADPTTPLGIASKQYVDGKALGLPTGTASGTNTYTVTFSPVPASLAALLGVPATVTFSIANTSVATLNPNGLGAVSLVYNGAALMAGALVANQTYVVIYNGTNFEVIGVFMPMAQRAYKPSDQSVTNSMALVNDNSLNFAVLAGEVWQFEVDLYATVATVGVGGLACAFTVPAGCTLQWSSTDASASVGTVSGTGRSLVGASGTGTYMTKIIGQVIVGSTAGTVQMQFAQATSNATATTMKAGSSLIATRMNP
jgi:hypothetical protein